MTRFTTKLILSCALCYISPVTKVYAQNVAPTVPITPTPRSVPSSFADLANRLLPSVVNVSTSAVLKPEKQDDQGPDSSNPDGPQVPEFPPGSPLEKFYHDYMNHKPAPNRPPRRMQALGSGFIIDPAGIIVTNNHVIEDADQITVTLHDGTEMPARIVGRDSQVDLAVLEVKPPHPLPAVSLSNSDAARIGDWVLAIGNPLGLNGTVTAGIISSRGRNVDHGLYDDYIQTDAAINRGNSGGPLFNLAGEVIGINTLIYGGSGGGSIGIGFAIPANDARNIIDQLRKTGHVSRGWLGLKFQDVSYDIAQDLDFHKADGSRGKGSLVSDVSPKGPAAKAGLQVGDIITRVGDQEVTGQTMPRIVAAIAPGTKTDLTIWRKGKIQTIAITLGQSPTPPDMPPSDTHQPLHMKAMLQGLGLTVRSIDADIRTQYALSDDQRGVLVEQVTAQGRAASRGIVAGNVITQVGQEQVNTPDDFKRLVQRMLDQKKKEVLLLVQDDSGLRWVPVPFAEN
ncbi:Do family serine endopeptidase [Swingsia samuiensis]|uniref:Probable periplasmic serine endoprotease DegP-like n=1 Tax=Swingsia samuiensis TaxID=1293412 RepID=A0A4Y6UNT4_9PROT|nr:Do family serine endopeptidase [Swingsia samuiensis]